MRDSPQTPHPDQEVPVPDLTIAAPGYAATSAGDVLDLVRRDTARTRAEIGRRTGLSRTAVSARVDALLDAGLLTRGHRAGTGGRPAETLALAGDAGRVVSLAVGRSRSQVGVVDLTGRLLDADSLDHPDGAPPSPATLLAALAHRARGLLGDDSPAAVAVGLSLPASVDATGSRVQESLVLPAWDHLDPSLHLAELGGLPIVVGNDADVLASAELQARPDLRDALVVKASTGIAVGIVSDGRVLHGHRGAAGELGHVRTPSAEGRLCRCGSTGCLETVAAGWALVEEARLGAGERPAPAHVRDLVAAAREGDAGARELLAASSRHVGEALATAVTLLNPEVVVLAGDMGSLYDVYAAGVREAIWPRLASPAARDLRLEPSGVDGSPDGIGGLVGAASMTLDRLMSPPSVDAWLSEGRPRIV